MGKKTKEHYEVTPSVIRKVERLAARGLTIIQIGISLGWSEDTIHRKKKENKELSESIKKGQSKGIETMTNALFKRGKGYSYKETHDEVRADEKGKITKHKKVVKKHVAPDTTAQIFYLKNRDPDNWKDKRELTHSGDIIIKTDSDDDGL